MKMADVSDIKDLAKNVCESAVYLGFTGLGFLLAKTIVEVVVSLL
ncbi:MAG: hypothetical protein ACTSUF_03670 [Candidatus Heimdallarchaeaceae archaeon]